MVENRFAQGAFAPEAADEPASLPSTCGWSAGAPDDDDAFPDFASEAEAAAYYRGLTRGIRAAGREPGHPHMPADFSLDLARDSAEPGLVSGKLLEAWPEDQKSRATRHDGWTPHRQRVFLDALARTGVVADACRAAGMSRDSAYELRKRAEGRAFALGWDAAILQSRRNVADDVMSRARHGVIDRVYRNGELVAERHRYDNRLTMAVLTRLDRLAEGLGEGAATARIVAGEWDQFLDLVEAGGEGAEDFLRARANPPRDGEGDHAKHGGGGSSPVRSRTPLHHAASRRGPPPRSGEDQGELESVATLLARLALYKKYQAGLAHEIPTADLDPARMEEWTDEQWDRADLSGFLDRLPDEAWHPAARSRGDHDSNGMCRVRRFYLDRHPEDSAPDDSAQDDCEDASVWSEDGDWVTDFPPPPGFDGWEEGEPGHEGYRRTLSDAEQAVIDAVVAAADAEEEAEKQALLARLNAARDRFFGFAPAGEEAPEPGPDATANVP